MSPSGLAPTVAEVDLSAIRSNLALIRAQAERPVMAVVKANAYGHGAARVSQFLTQECGIDFLSVATLPEAIALRETGITTRILVFGNPLPGEIQAFVDHDLDLTIGSAPILEAVITSGLPVRVHLHVDTGMTRLGLVPRDAVWALSRLDASAAELAGLATHFAASDLPDNPLTSLQLDRWTAFLKQLGGPPCPVHIAASGGALTSVNVAAESDWVRAGIALYGLYESVDPAASGLRASMHVHSRIARIATVPKGTAVSYGGRWTAPRETRIVTVAAGYADGIPRLVSNRGEVSLAGVRCPVVGSVCMDMLMAEVSDPQLPVKEGDRVSLLGGPGPTWQEAAKWAETITYELACGISPRVPRIYRGINSVF